MVRLSSVKLIKINRWMDIMKNDFDDINGLQQSLVSNSWCYRQYSGMNMNASCEHVRIKRKFYNQQQQQQQQHQQQQHQLKHENKDKKVFFIFERISVNHHKEEFNISLYTNVLLSVTGKIL
uniref:Uncharacterized protein n=1 Tax=Glossina austeni TaxID=7395 RepID=A0A1A9UIF5_GLOAU